MSSLPVFATTLPAAVPRTLALTSTMTDEELFRFCRLNEDLRIERTREGLIEMNAPAGSLSSDGNGEFFYQLKAWWKMHRRGRVYDSSAGFHLPDGSMLSPDVSYFTEKTFINLTLEDRKGFPHACPEFVVELRSETDRLPEVKRKMEHWLSNGVELGWLINPSRHEVCWSTPQRKRSLRRSQADGWKVPARSRDSGSTSRRFGTAAERYTCRTQKDPWSASFTLKRQPRVR